jgi:hemolysin activation/secretion protein
VSSLRRLALLGSCCLGVAHAQVTPAPSPTFVPTPAVVPNPSELTPRITPPPTDPDLLAPPRETPRVAREVGKPDDEIKLDVKAYAVSPDAPAALKAALPTLTASFTGQGRSFEDLVNASAEVTRFLQRDLGYYLGYAYIPEQDMKDGVVRIGVLEGRLDRVELNWSDGLPVDREVVQAYLDHLKPGAILTVRDIERVVFLLNDLRGISVRAEVRAGSRPGTAVIAFTPKADNRISGKLDFDLNGSRHIGLARLGALVSVNSPTGAGDGLTATALASTTGGLGFALAAYTRPIGSNGLKAGVSVFGTKYRLNTEDFPLGYKGHSSALNAFALYPWVRSRNLNLFSIGALDYKSYVDSVASLVTRKHVGVGNIGVTGDFRDSVLKGGVNTFELSIAHGTISYDGGAPSGIDDAPSYTKLNFGFSRLQDVITGRVMGYVTVNGQYALRNLDTTEQFRAGGPDAVRAFAPGEGTGDSGVVMSAEVRVLPTAELMGKYAREFVFGAFVDAAMVQLRHDPNLLPREATYNNRLTYSGVGVSAVWQRSGTAGARMSLAWPTHGTATSDPQQHKPRVYLQASYLF